jgi:hypothetical protein
MKELPILIKSTDRKYTIGVDVAYEGVNEIFTFCVQYMIGKQIILEQIETIINKVEYKIDSPIEKYIQELSEYYNAPIFKEF